MGQHRASRDRSSHAHGHAHGGPPPDVEVNDVARVTLLVILAAIAVATVVGLIVLWPDEADAPDRAAWIRDGASSVVGDVESVGPSCPVIVDGEGEVERPEDCDTITVRVNGQEPRINVPPYVARAGLQPGDQVRLIEIDGDQGTSYGYLGVVRDLPIGILAVAFVLLVALIARLRGVLALVGLGVAAVLLATFLLPALLAGGPGTWVALVGSSAIMFVVLYLAHGPSLRTSAALAGTLAGILVTALIGLWAVRATRLSGIDDETGDLLATYARGLDHRGLLTCAVIIAGLGVLNDVTITQASAVWELRAAAPHLSRAELFTSGMRIGRDHIASTIYTIVFAYAGTGLAVLLLLSLYDRPFAELLSDESLGVEAVRTLASAIGLVLAVPFTTAVAAATVVGPRPTPA